MNHKPYQGVRSRFLREDERLIVSKEQEMPLVIEAEDHRDPAFLQQFLADNSSQLISDLARYGAVLLRGFAIKTDEDFEKTVLSIPEFKGISEAFMAENGRVHVGDLKYVLHTNAVYKTGGTIYLGGFHTENYYSADVPAYICFCCLEPSTLGGETGLINTEKVYRSLSASLQEKLEKNPYFVGKWLLSEVARRYQISENHVKKICEQFKFPIIGEGEDQLILMYKPSVFEHPFNQKKALQINLFELPTLNKELRKRFMDDYPGKTWYWHRFFWKLPLSIFNAIEHTAVAIIAFFHSPKHSLKILKNKWKTYRASKFNKEQMTNTQRVGDCFSDAEVKDLARVMREQYCSCIWQKGDILLVDNRKVMHAGMPGIGPRIIRAMICNPIQMDYTDAAPGCLVAEDRVTDTVGAHIVGTTSRL
ncbi:MAG: TauD/TfdA family dioxygenase [Legionella sp.]|jgi:alpha-ketoglutarate-dependent taurine dioxygenase